MKKKLFTVLHVLFWVNAPLCLAFCIWDAMINGLFAAATNITGGIGIALVVTVLMLAQTALSCLIAYQLGKLDKNAFRNSVALFLISVLNLVFSLIGHYFISPSVTGLLLPAALFYCMKLKA